MFCFMVAIPAQAANVPREFAPSGAIEDEILVAENLTSDVLEKRQNGLGYGPFGRKQTESSAMLSWYIKQTATVMPYLRVLPVCDMAVPGYVPTPRFLQGK